MKLIEAGGESRLPDRLSSSPAWFCLAAFSLLAVASYSLPVFDLLQALSRPALDYRLTDRDFANYWMAARLVLAGEHHSLFAHESYFSHFTGVFGVDSEIRSWSYPPHFLLFIWPLAFLSYKTALVTFLVVTLVLFASGVVLFRRVFAPRSELGLLWMALAGYAVMMLAATQNGFLTAGALLLGLSWMRQRPLFAGLAFAFLTVKPQLCFLIPLLLLFDRNWKAIGWSLFFTVVLVVLSRILFGSDSWTAYLTQTLAYQRSVMTDWEGIFLRMMPTVFGSVRTLGLSAHFASQMQWCVSVPAAALVAWMLWQEHDPLRRAFIVTCGTFVITPYAFNYDMGALSAVASMLIGSDKITANRSTAIVIGVIATLAGVVANLGRANLPIAPLLLAAGLLVVAVDTRRHTIACRGTIAE